MKISKARLKRAVDAAFGEGSFDSPTFRHAYRMAIRAALRAYHQPKGAKDAVRRTMPRKP